MQEALEVNFPAADLEVKIVLPIPFRDTWLRSGFCCVRILCKCWQGLQGDNHGAQ